MEREVEIRSQRHAVGLGWLTGAALIVAPNWPGIARWPHLMQAWSERRGVDRPLAGGLFVYVATAILSAKAALLVRAGLPDALHTQLAPNLPRGFAAGTAGAWICTTHSRATASISSRRSRTQASRCS